VIVSVQFFVRAVTAVTTITSEGTGEVCGATEPKAGTGHGVVVAVVGALVVAVVAGTLLVVDELVLEVGRCDVVVRPVAPSSSSPLQAAAASDSTRASARAHDVGLVRTASR
jgi:hypothetical protein